MPPARRAPVAGSPDQSLGAVHRATAARSTAQARRLRRSISGRDLNVALAADEQRRPLMQLRRHDVENRAAAVRRRSAGLLADERQRIRLVEQPQLAPRGLAVGGIHEDATGEQVAMEVGHQRADVAHVVGRDPVLQAAVREGGASAPSDPVVPVPVALVDAVELPRCGVRMLRMRQQELADGRIEREPVHPAAPWCTPSSCSSRR